MILALTVRSVSIEVFTYADLSKTELSFSYPSSHNATFLKGFLFVSYSLVFLGALGTIVVLVVVCRVEELPGVDFLYEGGPLAQQLAAAEGQIGQGLVLRIRPRKEKVII